jgi:hypothetical protein
MADSEWYEQAMERYRLAAAKGATSNPEQPVSGDGAGDASAEATPGTEESVPALAGSELTGAIPELGAPSRRNQRGLTALLLTAVLLVGAGVGAYFAVGQGASASAAVSEAMTHSLGNHTADITMTMTAHVAGQSVSMHATGATNFTNQQTNMTMQISSGGQNISERAVYDGQTVFVNLGNLIGAVVPGKSWVSINISQATSATGSSGLPSGGAGDPSAMLRLMSAQGNSVTPLGGSVIDGVSVQGYAVKMTPAAVARDIAREHLPSWIAKAVSLLHNTAVTYDVYINGANLLERMTSTVASTVDNQKLVENIQAEYSNYGAPVTVVDPPASQVLPFNQFVADAAQRSSTD